jgi:hypothetical protein
VPQYLTVQRTLVDGTTTIGGNAIDTSGTTKISQTVTVPTGTVNQIVSLTLDVSEVDHYFIMATQDMTVTTNGTDEVQTLTPSGTISGGTFTITYSGQTTSAIAHNATAATIQAALTALSNIDDTDGVVCAGGPINTTPVTITFRRSLSATNVAQVTITSSLTGGGSLTPSTTTAGVAIAETKTFYSNSPLDWKDSDGYFTNPFSTDITRLLISNASGTDGTFYFYAVSP